jgi:predicted nucleotidyltransferase
VKASTTALGGRIPKSGMIVPKSGTMVPMKRTKSADQVIASAPNGLAGVLFTPVQQRVLGLLFGQPQRRFQSAELIRLAGSGTGSAHRLLTRLAAAGLVTTERVGNQKHYQANAESPVFAELSGLVRKTVGLVAPLQAALEPLAGKISAAFVYGSIAKGTDKAASDIDLMVIADGLDYAALFSILQEAEESLARKVNPNLMSRGEWRRKRAEPDSFAARIAGQPHLFVLGSEDELG